MENKFTKYIVVGILLFLMIFGISLVISNFRKDGLLEDYKKTLIENDSLRKIDNGHYQKLVNDMKSTNQILSIIKEDNKNLYKYLKEQGKKPISYTSIDFKPDDKINTIPINIKEKDGLTYFNDYYPHKEDYFINYHGVINKDSLNSSWTFKPIKIGIVVSEKTKGLFEADLTAPDWITVNSIEVNSLPLSDIKKDNFDWLIGVSGGLNYLQRTPVFDLETGFRYKKSIFSIQGTTNNEVKFGYKKLF